MQKESIQSMGGKARAEALSEAERKEIAKKAAAARWDVPKVTHKGELVIGNIRIPCAVLDDGKRIFSETGITNAILGSRSGASKRLKKASETSGAPMPLFLAASNLNTLITKELSDGPLKPIYYRDGKIETCGYEAHLLPAVCEIWLKAREDGLLQKQQYDKAKKAEILMRGLAHVGVIALVDEVTGYQYDRAKKALAEILEQFIAKELRAWTKTFPAEFYEHIFRLHNWKFDPANFRRPAVIGHYTNDIVYKRLAPGVLKELRNKNPVVDGRRKHKHFQWLTGEVGDPKLRSHIDGVLALMRISESWNQFKSFLKKAYPKHETTELGFDIQVSEKK